MKFIIYTKDYNGLIDLIQVSPDELYAKMLIFLDNQEPLLYDPYMKNVFSCIITNKKIPNIEKKKYMKMVEQRVQKDQLISGLFSIDFAGNSLLSLVCELDDLDLLNSILEYLNQITAFKTKKILNYTEAIYQKNSGSLLLESLKSSYFVHSPRLSSKECLAPKSLFEVAFEIGSLKMIEYLIHNEYSKESISRLGYNLTKLCLLTKNISYFELMSHNQILNQSEFILYVDICFLSNQAYLQKIIMQDNSQLFLILL